MKAHRVAHPLTLTAVATALAVALSGCTASSDPSPGTTIATCTNCTSTAGSTEPTTSTTKDSSAQEQADRAAAEALWRKYVTVLYTLDTMPANEVEGAVKGVATEPSLSRMLKKSGDDRAAGRAAYGVPVSYVLWPASINGAPTAVLLDCQDGSQAGDIDVRTGNKLTVGTANTPIQATLNRTTEGWRVVSSELVKGKTCTPEG